MSVGELPQTRANILSTRMRRAAPRLCLGTDASSPGAASKGRGGARRRTDEEGIRSARAEGVAVPSCAPRQDLAGKGRRSRSIRGNRSP
jgi:hypothetical protein